VPKSAIGLDPTRPEAKKGQHFWKSFCLGYARQKAEGERFCLGFKIGQIYHLFRISLREPLVPSYLRYCFILFAWLPLAPLFSTSTAVVVHVHRSCRRRYCARQPQVAVAAVCVHRRCCAHLPRCCAGPPQLPPPLLCASAPAAVRIHRSCRRRCCARPPRCCAGVACCRCVMCDAENAAAMACGGSVRRWWWCRSGVALPLLWLLRLWTEMVVGCRCKVSMAVAFRRREGRWWLPWWKRFWCGGLNGIGERRTRAGIPWWRRHLWFRLMWKWLQGRAGNYWTRKSGICWVVEWWKYSTHIFFFNFNQFSASVATIPEAESPVLIFF